VSEIPRRSPLISHHVGLPFDLSEYLREEAKKRTNGDLSKLLRELILLALEKGLVDEI